jgi:bifunctional non-homologous end joining protein LigD
LSTGRDRGDEREDFSGFSLRPTKSVDRPTCPVCALAPTSSDADGGSVPGTAWPATSKQKRDFQKTREPSGKATSKASNHRRFVIQRHDATRLHYHLRLELDGVFKS